MKHAKQILYEKIMSYGDSKYMMGKAEYEQHKFATDEALFRTSEETKGKIVELINLLIVKRELEMKEKWGEYDETEQTMYRDILEYIDIYGEQAGWLRVKQVCRMALKGNDPREVMRDAECQNYTAPAPAPVTVECPVCDRLSDCPHMGFPEGDCYVLKQPAPKVTDEYARGVEAACSLLEKDILTDGQVSLGERWSQDYPQWKSSEIRKELKAPTVAPKVTDDADAIICYGCMTSELNCPYGYVLRTAQQGCEHKTPKQPTPKVTDVGAFEQSLLDTVSQACDEAGRSRHQTIPDFIRSLAQRAGEERYTIPEIGHWLTTLHATAYAQLKLNDPQGGIKAVIKRKGG